MNKICVIILTGGKGSRMGGDIPKVLNKIVDKPIIFWTLELLKSINLNDIIVVTGYKSDFLQNAIMEQGFKVRFVNQNKRSGTAGAVKIGLKKVSPEVDTVLVLYGDDSALYRATTIKAFISSHLKKNNFATVLSTSEVKPLSSGGFISDSFGNIVDGPKPKEIKDEKSVENYIACGAFCFKRDWLITNIKLIKRKPDSEEYPLLAIARVGVKKKEYVKSFPLNDYREWNSVNTPEELKEANRKKIEILQTT